MCLLVLILALTDMCNTDMPTDEVTGYDIKQIIISYSSLPTAAGDR